MEPGVRIAVCVKRVPDPDIAPSLFRVDEEAMTVVLPPGVSPVINPFDVQAVEAALRIRDAAADPTSILITVVTLDLEGSEKMSRQMLALGADEGVVISDNALQAANSSLTAQILAAAIEKIGSVDLVLTGRQATDSDAGVVGLGLAELLDLPAVTLAKAITLDGIEIVVERALGERQETVTASLPAVVTVAHELGAVRKPSLRETMKAGRKPIQSWHAADLGLDANAIESAASRTVRHRLYLPQRNSECEWVTGDTVTLKARALVEHLAEQKLL